MPARTFVGARTLAPFLEPFAAELTAAGYGTHAMHELLRGVRHLDDWISAQGLAVDQCDDELIVRFDVRLSMC